MNTSDLLNKAADLIEERGWTTLGPLDHDAAREAWFPKPSSTGPLCLEGGLNAACLAGVAVSTDSAMKALAEHLAWRRRPLFAWNDAVGRTAAEVIEVLRACAVIEQAREEQDAAWATYAGLVTA